MASAFTLAINPWVYLAQYQQDGAWKEEYLEQPHKTPQEEAALPETERNALLAARNSFPQLPLVNYTTQYGMGAFEGLKAFPQKGGGLKIFRPDENAKRLRASMEGLQMPGIPEELLVAGVKGIIRRNYELGFAPEYDPAWENDGFVTARSVYVRPFTYSEPGIGLNLSAYPWVVAVSTPVGSYFDPDAPAKGITTRSVRAFPGGTGWIKCDANYVVPTLEKKRVQKLGYMEAVFLDAFEHKYVEEGSSCNIFFYQKSGALVTPALGDTILPGITRKSAIQLAKDLGITVEERPITIEEAMSETAECFVTGTAAGVTYIESLEHEGGTMVFNRGRVGDLTRKLQDALKGIQYGVVEDKHGWMFSI